jgi:hypothetical protein
VYAEVRGKYARPSIKQPQSELPILKSRAVSALVSSSMSRKSSIYQDDLYQDINQKQNVEELQKMLRQERLVIII